MWASNILKRFERANIFEIISTNSEKSLIVNVRSYTLVYFFHMPIPHIFILSLEYFVRINNFYSSDDILHSPWKNWLEIFLKTGFNKRRLWLFTNRSNDGRVHELLNGYSEC